MAEFFYSETASGVVKIKIEDGRVVGRWELPKSNTPVAKPGESFQSDTGIQMQWIPAGSFLRGSSQDSPGHLKNESPVQKVRFAHGFWAAKHETTQSQWERLGFPASSRFAGENKPVERVSWEQAREFTQALTDHEKIAGLLPPGYRYRWPTESEWEYFARAGTKTDTWRGNLPTGKECFADPLESIAWYCGNSLSKDSSAHNTKLWGSRPSRPLGFASTHPVGRKLPNPWGLYDVLGNVSEWCLDTYFPDYADADPTGRAQGVTELPGQRVIRGGSWLSGPSLMRVSARRAQAQDVHLATLGFRVVLVRN